NAEELIGEDVFGFLPPGVRAKRREAFNEVVRTGKTARFTDNLRDKWLDNVLYPVLDPEGKTVRVAIISRDITEQKKAEEVREKLLLELQSALDNVKTLSGLLPVCPSCKSVKDDEGYWGKLEEYLSSHSDIKVSMDLCPDCTKNLYPEKESSDVTLTPLTKREKEVLSWISQGKNTWDIAHLLNIKESTVKFHVSNILRKLDVSSRPQAVAIAMELRLLDSEILKKQTGSSRYDLPIRTELSHPNE
ncbi:helix-turn-helix transcriptional regulator, partial [bacterium]|nr:helix-turn-helix transcriptional regulator [bacterium]